VVEEEEEAEVRRRHLCLRSATSTVWASRGTRRRRWAGIVALQMPVCPRPCTAWAYATPRAMECLRWPHALRPQSTCPPVILTVTELRGVELQSTGHVVR
jgi:hypothetical protein